MAADRVSDPQTAAEAKANNEMQRLAKQLQELKIEAAVLNKDLKLMEEKLLFPSSTRLTVFVSAGSGQFFTLEAVKLKLDSTLVATHLYSEKQYKAMLRGGIHQLYMTNVNNGYHEATVFFTGIGPDGQPFKRAETHVFEKGEGSEYLEIRMGDNEDLQEPKFQIRHW